MSTFWKLGTVAAAAIAVVVLAINLAPASQPTVGAPSPVPSVRASDGAPGPVDPDGSYNTINFALPLTMQLEPGWNVDWDSAELLGASRPVPTDPGLPASGLAMGPVPNTDGDVCTVPPPAPPASMTAKDLAEWLAAIRTVNGSDPVEVEVAGLPAWRVDENFVGRSDCEVLHPFRYTLIGDIWTDEQKRFYFFDVGGRPWVAVLVTPSLASDGDMAEAEKVLASVTFR